MSDPKTLKAWLKLNPSHKCTLRESNRGDVRATLHGGEGIDQRLVGEGEDEVVAISQALRNREAIRAELP